MLNKIDIASNQAAYCRFRGRRIKRVTAFTVFLMATLQTSGAFFLADIPAQAASSKRLGRPGLASEASTSTINVETSSADSQTLAGQVDSGPPQAMSADQQVAHLLNRITFGARPGDLEAVRSQGIKNFIAAQLNPSSIAESPEVTDRINNTAALQQPATELVMQFRSLQKARQQAKKANPDGDVQKPVGGENGKKRLGQEIIEARLDRAINSNRQLEEVMTDFWYNHFNISIDKGLDHALVGAYEEQAIRPFALGHFRDLLGATCHHPAMLFYLDNWQNSKAGVQDRKGKESGLNENYARELMELHTLGVDGGYTQKDVQELARVLTGLGLAGPRMLAGANGGFGGGFGNGGGGNFGRRRFGPRAMVNAMANQNGPDNSSGNGAVGSLGDYFNASHHDFGDKVVLGQHIAGTGEQEIEQALDMLARHPSTAHHIAYQLAQYFVADNPPKALVDRLANKFSQTDGDIKAVMSSLLDSPEFWDGRYSNDKYKSPFRYAVSVFRASNAKAEDYMPVAQFLRLQGQPLYGCLTPDGYKNTRSAWLNPDALMNRINFATTIGTGRAKFLTGPPVAFDTARDTVNGGHLTAHTEAVIDKSPASLKLALLMGSPEFMRY